MNIEWDSSGYAGNFSFVHEYGKGVLDLVPAGSGIAVDLGSGTGALTGKLAKKGYETLDIDASEEMLEKARSEFPNLKFMQADALSFSLPEKASVIFSNAVFHWIDRENQDVLAQNLCRQLKPGGLLVAEFGGFGCGEAVHSMLETCFAKRGLAYLRPFYFPTIGEYAMILERNGFRVLFATLFDRPTEQKSEHGVKDWCKMFVKKPFEGLSQTLTEEILDETEASLKDTLFKNGKWFIDYVRIRVKAKRV